MGIIGKPAAAYSSFRKIAIAQKCGGVHKNTIANKIRLAGPTRPSSAASMIIGAVAPAAPPITMFCGVRGLSQMV